VKVFYLIFGLGFSFFLHRIRFIYLFLILVLEYILCLCYSYLGRIVFIILTWLICIAFKACIEFDLLVVPDFLNFLPDFIIDYFVSVDSIFQFVMLKIISFNMEYSIMYENNDSKIAKLNTEKEEHFQKCKDCQEGYFCLTTLKKYIILKRSDFSFLNLIIYALYPPFYIAGPTIMYHSFIFQLQTYKENKHNHIFFKKKIIFIIKCFLIFVAFEIFNHFIYIHVLLNNHHNKEALKLFKEKQPHYIYFFFVFNRLVFVFMKYDVIWKISRLWGWMDGICCEDNINRCVYNNYSFEGFWRQWHRSFNIWLIRYMYIPMGGSKYKFINTFIIFSFVALWHEMKFHLLVWAWSIYLTLIPEIIIKRYFTKKERQYLTDYFWFRYLRAFACSIDILLMTSSNLVGYGFEEGEILESFKEIFNFAGVLGVLCFLLFFALNTFPMFFVRDLEEANGIKKNY
jgi:D-alanyl-lipoteichoic acid acyltransferase DltB (MBOAT superfamily)